MSKMFNQGYAVVIGVGADLPITEDDASAVANLLRDSSRCAYPSDQVELLIGEHAHREAILNSLDRLKNRVDSEATVLVYFSGHGIETPEYYLMPFGYDLSNLSETAISGKLFTKRLQSIKAKKVIVILDCCHAGGQTEVKGWIKSPLPSEALIQMGKGSGKVILASSRKDEVSWTGQPYSVFTAALLEGLIGYGSFESDGYARILDVAMWVGRKVPERTSDKQHPIIKVSHLEENFALAWYAAGQKKPRPLDWMTQGLVLEDQIVNFQQSSLRHRLDNYRENLLLIEERMSDYIEYTSIPLQLLKEKKRTGKNIAKLRDQLGLKNNGDI